MKTILAAGAGENGLRRTSVTCFLLLNAVMFNRHHQRNANYSPSGVANTRQKAGAKLSK